MNRTRLNFIALNTVIAIFFGCFTAEYANAQTNTWLGGSGNWGNGSNWSLGVPGNPGHNALIDDGNGVNSFVIIGNEAFEVDHLTIDAGDVLEIRNNANLSIEDPNGMIVNHGDLRIINNVGCAATLRIHGNNKLKTC